MGLPLVDNIIHRKKPPDKNNLAGRDFLIPSADAGGGLGVKKDAREIPEVEVMIPTPETATLPAEAVDSPEIRTNSLVDQAKEMLKIEAEKGEGQFKVLNANDVEMEITRRITDRLNKKEFEKGTEAYDKAMADTSAQVKAENQQRQANIDFVNGDLQQADSGGIVRKTMKMPTASGVMRERTYDQNVNTQIEMLLTQLNEEGEILAKSIHEKRRMVIGDNSFNFDQFAEAYSKQPQGDKQAEQLFQEAISRFDKEAIIVEEKMNEPKNEASPERLNMQETTFQTAKDLLKVWDQNDNLVISKNKKELEIQDRRPVSERGRLGMLIATYEGTTLPEAKLFLSGEIHKLLRQQNIDPSISPELNQKVAELSKNDREYENIQADVLMRVASIARIDMPPGALRGDLLTDVLIAHACTKGLVVNQKTQTYELPEEARKAVSEWMEKDLMNGNDERLIKQLIAQDVTERVLSNIYGFDLALLEDTKNGPGIIAKRAVDIAHEEWMPDNLISMTPEDRAVALKQKTITENILLNDIGVAWQRFEEKTNNKKKFMQALGMLAMIALPLGDQLLSIGSFTTQQEKAEHGIRD